MEAKAIPAGKFSTWLHDTRKALAADAGADVPCGTCTACCRSGYFIHIRPSEKAALALIPKKYLVPAPRRPKGHVMLGHFADGHCPMLTDGACSIYAQRPLACRSYDCRVFAATGIKAGGAQKRGINARVKRWKFETPTAKDRLDLAGVRAAAKKVKGDPSRVALLAVTGYEEIVKG